MGIRIGFVGTGSFAQCFIPLFKAHPLVEGMILCDLDAEKLSENVRKHGIRDTACSLETLLDTDVDAVVIMTQNWLHAPQAVQALRAGKHVYSAVPAGITLEEIGELVKTVEATGRIYMIGETSYYYPDAIYCRERFRKGEFGHVVFTESEYYHDRGQHGVAKNRAGEHWREVAGDPPMNYPTHTVSMAVSVTGAYPVAVSCLGYREKDEVDIYNREVNRFGNEFSNETALFRMSDGSMFRVNEFRKIGYPPTTRMSLYGTLASFEDSGAGTVWATEKEKKKMDELLTCADRETPRGVFHGVAPIHEVDRLPASFTGLPNGHRGSHQFLVDDFVTACATGRKPPNHVWAAARYNIPGLVAHESAKEGGAVLEIPDFGDGSSG